MVTTDTREKVAAGVLASLSAGGVVIFGTILYIITQDSHALAPLAFVMFLPFFLACVLALLAFPMGWYE